MSDLVTNDPGLSVFFSVEIDSADLGAWTTCSGLGIEIETEGRAESSMSFMMHQVSGKLKYTNLQLSRPISPDSAKVLAWLTSYSALPITTAAEVTAYDPNGKVIMAWALAGVVPVRWTGPSFDASQLSVATEQLEIAYQGFL